MTELSSVKGHFLADSFRTCGDEEQAIGTLALRSGLELTGGDCRALAGTVRRLAEQVRAADAEFEHEDPLLTYLT